jgi:hypothetical protein
MMKRFSRHKKSVLMAATGFAMLVTGAAQAAWYEVNVVQVVPRMDSGDVVVQLSSATGAANSFDGIARGLLVGTEPGTNKMLAVMLSAIALNTTITVDLANAPSSWPPQPILGTGLVAPSTP